MLFFFLSFLKTWLAVIIGTFLMRVWEVGGMNVPFVFLSFVIQRDTAVTRNATMNEGCDLRYIVIPPPVFK